MKKEHNNKKISLIRRGQPITATYLTSMSEAINANTRFLSGPKQQNALDETEQGNTSGGSVTDLTFTETNRISETVEITDSNGDTHSIEQIDRVDLQNAAGQTLTLIFTNP